MAIAIECHPKTANASHCQRLIGNQINQIKQNNQKKHIEAEEAKKPFKSKKENAGLGKKEGKEKAELTVGKSVAKWYNDK